MKAEAPADRWRISLFSGRHADGRRGLALASLFVLALILARLPLQQAGAALLGAVILIATLIEPAVALPVLALAIPFGDLFPLPMPGVNLVDVLAGLFVCAWLARGLAQRELRLAPPRIAWPALALVWVSGLSLTQATSWRLGVPEWLKWAEFAALYVVAAQILRPGADGRLDRTTAWTLAALFFAAALEVGLGAYQFVFQVGPEAFILMGRFMRAYGTFHQPNPYAGYLGYLAPVAASLALGGLARWWATRNRRDLWPALGCAAAALLCGAGIVMSWSRGSWLGLAAALLVLVGVRSRRWAPVVLAGLFVAAAAIVLMGASWLPPSIARRLSDLDVYSANVDLAHVEVTDDNFAVLERLAHWQAGLDMFGDHPWLGVGAGNYAVAYPTYGRPHFYEALGHAHNVYINFLAESGVLGGLAFGAFWLAALWAAWRAARRSAGLQAALAIGVLGTLAYLSIHNLFDNLFVAHMQLQLALLLAGITATGGKA